MRASLLLAVVLSLAVVSWAQEQERRPVSERQESKDSGAAQPAFATADGRLSQENQAAAPRLVKFSGVLLDVAGKPLGGELEVTFALYKQEADEEPLWTETQRVQADERGGYTVLLGATQTAGMPAELFRSDEARWLGIQVQGQEQRPRTVLVSVPYALKAVDAEKLGGKSLADFVLSESLGDQVRRVMEGQTIIANQATPTGTLQPGQAKANSTMSPQATSPGPKFPPSTFSGTTTDQIVLVTQSGSGVGLVATSPNSAGSIGVSQCCNGVYGQTQATQVAAGGFGVLGEAVGANGVGTGVGGVADGTSGPTTGVFGRSVSPQGTGVLGSNNSSIGGTGVAGFANATSGFGNGVLGQTASTTQYAAGVVGFATASTGGVFGVSGTSDSNSGTGVNGYASSTTGPTIGVGGFANSNQGSGVLAYESSPTGQVYGVWGGTSSTSGAGVAGFNFGSSGYTNGVYGQSSSPSGNGVSGNALAISGFANGVYGQTASTDAAGVSGLASAPTGYTAGVVGQSNSSSGSGLAGYERATSGVTAGVIGQVFSPQGIAGVFSNVPGQGLILQGLSGNSFTQVFSVDTNGNLQISGNLIIGGTKSSTAKLQDGREVALYAVESPENWFEDFGSAELSNGVAWVALDSSFAQTVNAAVNYHVFLTANGDSNGLYVARKTAAGFEIREHGGGTSNVAFDYRIVARRRGYEAIRLLQVPERKNLEALHPHLKMATNLANVEPVKVIPPAIPAQAIRPAPPRPVVPAQAIQPIPQTPMMNVPQPPKRR